MKNNNQLSKKMIKTKQKLLLKKYNQSWILIRKISKKLKKKEK